MKENNKKTEKCLLLLDQEFKKRSLSECLLPLFLPLDIDMQVLSNRKNNKREEYLERMIGEIKELIKKNNGEKEFFTSKLEKVRKEKDNNDKLKEFFDGRKDKNGFDISCFVKNLDCLLKEGNEEKYDLIIGQAENFTRWYRNLADVLKSL